MKINEVFHFSSYPGTDYDIADIPNTTVLARLDEIGLSDMTKIYRLRQRGKPRLYGFLVANVFHVVWWDPNHEIWPSNRKHT